MLKYIKLFFLLPIDFLIFLYDLIFYKFFSKKNTERSYQFFLRLFLITGGITNDIIHSFLSKKKIFFYNNKQSSINNFENSEFFKNKGYFIKENFLGENELSNIKKFLSNQLGYYRSEKILDNDIKLEKLDVYNPAHVAFHYPSRTLLNCKEIQDLLINNEILLFAQNYLGSLPIIDLVECWWSFPGLIPDKEVAQMWHFDMDRAKWIKVFIFLEDCNLDNGPHSFLSETHKNNSLPLTIRKKGYARIEDNLVDKYFDMKKLKVFTAKKGTILFEDTRGLHKGERVKAGRRLILQFQFSSSLFGANTKKIKYPKTCSESFLKFAKNNKNIFSNFV